MQGSGVPGSTPFSRYMDKLVERETATRNPLVAAPALAVQFFLIPLAVVGVTVLVYVGFRSLLADDRTAQDYLTEVRIGGSDRRWPAAYELSRLMDEPEGARRPRRWRRRWSRRSRRPRTATRGSAGIWRWRSAGSIRRCRRKRLRSARVARRSRSRWTPDWWSRINGWTAAR